MIRKRKLGRRVLTLLLSLAMLLPLPFMDSARASAEGQVFCGLQEHVHTEDCYGLILACGQEESAGHTHTDECYTEQQVLSCGLEEGEEHAHSDACYTTERVLACGQAESAGHTHTEACWARSETPTCGLQEHVHTLECYSDFSADVEDYDDWCLFSIRANLTGDWARDLLTVARMQVGYTESTRNYIVVNGFKQGYTRYGAWFGQPYDEWCAMFVSFCLNFAQIPKEAVPYDDGTTRMVKKLEERELYHTVESGYTPKPGDLVFFCQEYDEQRKPGHVGIVSEVTEDTITTIEGNYVPSVRYFEYAPDYELIVGYGEMPENPDQPERQIPTPQAWEQKRGITFTID